MNRIVRFGVALAASASLPAFGGTLRVHAGPARTLAELSAQVRNSIVRPSTPPKRRPNAVIYDLGANAILIPGAGNLPGENGTYFRSDVMLVNYRNIDQVVGIAWLAQGTGSTSEQFSFYTLSARSAVALDDFVGQTLGKQGLGAVEIIGVDSSHNYDLSAYIDATSRIWTAQPGGAGTTSLQLASVSYFDDLDTFPAYAYGMKQTAGFHTNVGIVNLDNTAHTWTVSVNGQNSATTFSVTVPPLSLQQTPLPAGDFGDLWVAFQPQDAGFYWSAYAVSDDNTTGDGWAAHAYQP